MNEPLWLVEAFKHNNLKEVPGPGNNATIIKWLIALKAWWKEDLTPWCLCGDIEVLTDVGFVRFDELKKVNPRAIAQLNTETNEVEFVEDYGYIEKDYNGEVYNNNKLGLICDPEHKLYGDFTRTGNNSFKPIKDIDDFGLLTPKFSVHGVEHNYVSITKEDLTKEHYKGKLYCVQVPSMVFIIRTTKGIILPIGNCGTFVGWCLKQGKRAYPKHWYRAKAYLEYGTKLSKPAYGCIAITGRQGGGHVFFVVGQTEKGDIVGYGGNQSDAVNKRIFKKDSILGYRWPDKEDGSASNPLPERYNLPVYNSKTLSVVKSMA